MNLLLTTMICLAAPAAAPDVAVVCPSEFAPALAPWIAYREAQGRRIALVSNRGTAEQIRGRIREVAEQGGLRWVLLVGDAEAGKLKIEDWKLKISNFQSAISNSPRRGGDFQPPHKRRRDAAATVPVHLAEARVNVQYGSEPEIATDNWYADLDDDRVPDVAIGRLTADNAEELSRIVRKILDYERRADFGLWRRRVNFIAGVGGFGAWTDAILETATKKVIADGLPGGYASSMTYASWRSPYCPAPGNFAEVTRRRLTEGCLFWVYMGHGQRLSLDLLHVPGGRYRIFDVRDVPELDCRHGSPIALFLACYAGAFDGPRDCLAEELLAEPEGPVAVIAGSRVTMPYAMAVLGTSLLDQCFVQKRETLGEALLAAKRRMMGKPGGRGERRAESLKMTNDGMTNDEGSRAIEHSSFGIRHSSFPGGAARREPRPPANRQLLDLLASVLSPSPELLAAERLEHVQLFNLLGDPLLRLRYPQKVDVRAPAEAEAGSRLVIEGTSPIAGKCTVELVARRGRLTFHPPQRPEYDPSAAALAEMQTVYRKANDPRYAVQQFAVEPGKFRATLDVPQDAWGTCRARVFVQGASSHALGAAAVEVKAEVGKRKAALAR